MLPEITIRAEPPGQNSVAELLRDLRLAEAREGFAVSTGSGMAVLRKRGPLLPISEIGVALGSAGAFAGLYKVVRSYLERYKDRELVIETKMGKIVVKGHSMADELEVLAALGLDSADQEER